MLISANDSGLISRQELVSMLPPLCLNIQSNDLVLDMCAAPGSKTGQMLEMIGLNKGGVVANDVDFARASMLIHQIQRINNSSGILVVNHMG
jgi:16S rRNA C967 or C1407 C5-methylase (RsmB/RsmF family)